VISVNYFEIRKTILAIIGRLSPAPYLPSVENLWQYQQA